MIKAVGKIGQTTYFEVKCPACGRAFMFEKDDIINGVLTCPLCDRPDNKLKINLN